MDLSDFPTSPAKRQRTDSPETMPDANPLPAPPPAPQPVEGAKAATVDSTHDAMDTKTEAIAQEGRIGEIAVAHDSQTNDLGPISLLDALMLQVEAESTPITAPRAAQRDEEVINKRQAEGTERPDIKIASTETDTHNTVTPTGQSEGAGPVDSMELTLDPEKKVTEEQRDEGSNICTAPTEPDPSERPPPTIDSNGAHVVAPSETVSANGDDQGAEWEIDSSPYESSSDTDSSSDSDSSDDDSDGDGDYPMLDPEETARILMQGDGGSDDEGGRSRDKPDGLHLRTANERFEEVIPRPDVVVTEDMKIEELGNVELVVESTVVIKAQTSGEYQVLEPGSLICLQNRTVVGVVADLIGRVEEPRYTIRFTNDKEVEEIGVSSAGTTVFYVPDHSTFVFTQPLKNVKGSDASNFHDEEVGEDEIEFSDDEAEAEHKRQLKAKRQGRLLDGGRGRGGSRPGRASHRGGASGRNVTAESAAYGNGSLEINYDDVPDGGDDGYTPLQRPENLTELLSKGSQSQEGGMRHPLPPPPPSTYTPRGDLGGRGRGSGRGGRARHHQHRGRGGGGGGGGFHQSRTAHFHGHDDNNNGNTTAQHAQTHFSRPTAPHNLNLPTTPSLTPQGVPHPAMSPSPITPLPYVPFNFGAFPPSHNFNTMHQSMSGGGAAFPPNLTQQYQPQAQALQPPYQSYGQPAQQQQGTIPPPPPPFTAGPWANNPALAAALQRQMEEERRRKQGL